MMNEPETYEQEWAKVEAYFGKEITDRWRVYHKRPPAVLINFPRLND